MVLSWNHHRSCCDYYICRRDFEWFFIGIIDIR